MSLSTWLRQLAAVPRKTMRHGRRPQKSIRRKLLYLEHLEDRLAPATLHWTGTDAPNVNWSDAKNWAEGTSPQSGATLVFDSTDPNFKNAYTSNNDLTGLALNGIVIKAPVGPSFTLTGNAVTIANADATLTSGLTNISSAVSAIGFSSITLAGTTTFGSDAGTLSVKSAVSGASSFLTPGLLEGQAVLNGIDVTGAMNPAFGTDVQPGTTMAETGGSFLGFTPLPTTQHTWTYDDTWIYTGTIFWPNDPATPGRGTLSFADKLGPMGLTFDDMRLKIDGNDYLPNASFDTPLGTGGITLAAGPHTFEARFANYIYGHDWAVDPAWTGWGGSDFIFRTDNGTHDPLANSKNVSDYFQTAPVYPGAPLGGLVADPGDGTLFQTVAPSILKKTGAGTLILSGTNTYAGGTIVTGGTIDVTNPQALGSGPVTLAGGTLSLQGGAPAQTYANNVVVTANATIDVQNYPATMGALTVGGGTLTVTGTGPSLSSGPSLTLGDTTLLGNATLAPGASFGQALNLGTIMGIGAPGTPATLTVSGPGIVNLGNVPQGVTLAGTGRIGEAVSVTAGGAVNPGNAPGTTGTLNFLSDISFAGGVYYVELGGASAGSFDQISSGGTVSLNSTSELSVSLVNGFVPATGQTFTIIRNTGSKPISGTFAGLPEGAFLSVAGIDFTITYLGGSGHDVVLTRPYRGPITHFAVIPNVSTVGAGSPVTFTVTALDRNNLWNSYTGTVKFTSTDPQAVLPANATLTSGTGTFNVTFRTAGTETLTASDTITPSISGTSNPTVTVTPLAAVHFLVTAPPAFVPGKPFNFTVTAEDQFNNLTSAYSGAVHFSSTDAAASLPADTQLTGGTGIFTATLNTAGAQILSVSDTFNLGIIGTSNLIQNGGGDAETASYFKVDVPGGVQTTGVVFPVTLTVIATNGATIPAYAGTVHFSSSDANAMLPADYTFVAADAGVHVFNVALNTAGSQTITVSDRTSLTIPPLITGTSSPVATRGLVVYAFTPTPTGFTATFSKPFVPGDLTMYGTGVRMVQDVTLVGAHVGAVSGSLIIDPSNMSVTFKATENSLLAFFSSPILPNDTYTVTLVSGSESNGFLDALGANLDGANNAGHANYTTTFTTANASKAILSVSDFARGPDGAHVIKVPNDTASGIPVTLSNATSVKDVVFTLNFNPTLLTPTGAGTGDSSAAGSTFTMGSVTNIDATHGVVTFTYHNGTAQNGTVVLGDILAIVPDSAAGLYKSKELLTLSSITVNGAAFTGVAAGGVHVNAYFGDVTGNGSIDGLDVAYASTVARGTATGFVGFTLLDPAIVGDVANDISVDAGDVSDLAAYTVHLPTPVIPAIPTGLTITPSGPDPILSLAGGLQESGTVSVPVMLDHPHPVGSTGMNEAILALTYNPSVLTVSPSDITLGSIPGLGKGWQLTSVVDQSTGQIGIELYSLTPITAAQAGTLVNIAFHVVPGVSVPATAVQLVNSVTPNGHWFSTEVADAQGQFVLSLGMDRLVIQTGVSPVALAAPSSTGNVVTAAAIHGQVEGLAPSVAEESAGSTSLLLGSEPNEVFAVISNGAAAGETAALHTVPANVVVTDNLAFRTNVASSLAAQLFQFGSLPLLNTLLYRNGPAQLAADQVFLALARWTEAPADNSLNLFQNNLGSYAAVDQDWLAIPTQAPAIRTRNNSSVAMLDQKATDQQNVSDRTAVVDKVYGRLADDMDDFSDLGDF